MTPVSATGSPFTNMLSPAITTRHFEIFLTMILSRNMSEAADKLGISMAAVSKSLKGLERETGLTLFRNTNGRLTATAEAERLLPFAQRRSEEHTSELQSHVNLVCRLLLE